MSAGRGSKLDCFLAGVVVHQVALRVNMG